MNVTRACPTSKESSVLKLDSKYDENLPRKPEEWYWHEKAVPICSRWSSAIELISWTDHADSTTFRRDSTGCVGTPCLSIPGSRIISDTLTRNVYGTTAHIIPNKIPRNINPHNWKGMPCWRKVSRISPWRGKWIYLFDEHNWISLKEEATRGKQPWNFSNVN